MRGVFTVSGVVMKVAIVSGSVYGRAEEVARHAERPLKAAGLEAWQKADMSVAELLDFAPDDLLTGTSTTGMGALPENLLPLYSEIRDRLPAWAGKPAAVLALGDSSYDTFCGGGELIRELYAELGLREVVEMLRLDSSETVTPETDAEPWLQAFAAALKG